MTPLDPHLSLFAGPYRALVVGSSGALGSAFVEYLKNDPQCTHVQSLSKSTHQGFDLENEASIQKAYEDLLEHGPFHLIIDATGVLSVEGVGPEKALSHLNGDHMQRVFRLNTIGPALLIKYFSPLLATGPAVYAKLSARVGSISDNKKGGWYSYRSSKAALNMMLQTTAIELQRKNPELRVLAMQPGTVKSTLSKPFTAGLPHLLEPDESVKGLMNMLKSLNEKSGAYFMDHQGESIPW